MGKLIKRLAVPAVFTSAPNATKSVGMISSPPATPRRLLTNPILKPNSSAANTRTARASGSTHDRDEANSKVEGNGPTRSITEHPGKHRKPELDTAKSYEAT
jgi:hypothetical protein